MYRDVEPKELASLWSGLARAGETVSLTAYLAQGTYTVRFEGLAASGAALPMLAYDLQGVTLSDPIGPVGSDPTLDGDGLVKDNYEWTKDSLNGYSKLILDPLGDVAW